MGQKKGADYFKELNSKQFDLFMQDYKAAYEEYNEMLEKAWKAIVAGENPSKNHMYKMRQKTVDLEKFGKQFRERTVIMEKAE